jgi:hypothetical protein
MAQNTNWKCNKCGQVKAGNNFSIIHENCGGQFCLTTEKDGGAEVTLDCGVKLRAEIDRVIMDIDWQASRYRRGSKLKRYLLIDLELIEEKVKKLRELMGQAT